MEWKVGNALSRDVERQHLNKILADIRTTITTLSPSASQKPVTNTINTVTRYAVARFTITLSGDVTGSTEVDGTNDVTIETVLNTDNLDFVEEAPIDSRSYWRRNGEWRVVPTYLGNTPDGSGILVQSRDAEDVPYEIAREIEVVTGDLTITDGDGQAGNPTLGLPDTGVAAGTYGDASNIPQITVDAKGRITEIVDISVVTGGGGGILPVVTGDVPPVFVYLEDGSLVYTEVA
jgi:hypothetical protein